MNLTVILCVVGYLLLAPILGGLLSGVDRIISARMQGRVGPPLLQPFYDVFKLFEKENIVVNPFQGFYILGFVLFVILTGAIFFAGQDMLLVIFALTLASIFFVLGAYSTNSPYSHIGAEREMIQMMSYEPMVILTAVGMFMVTKSFAITDIFKFDQPMILYLPGVFLGFLYILTIKFRKSPFDLSMSHHAHQELVKGITTEFSGRTLAWIEISHWYENIFLLGFVYLFFSWNPIIGIIAALVTYFLEILIDNTYARVKWQLTLASSWIIAGALGFVNLFILFFYSR